MTLSPSVVTAYDAALFDDNFPVGIENHYWFTARNAVLGRALDTAIRSTWIPVAPKILEVGCGTGIVVEGLARRGFDIRGVELGHPPRALGSGRIRTGLAAEELEAEIRAEIDTVMFLDVIEHVPDDVALLRDTLAAFPACRAVVVTVPARPELWSDHDRYYGHYRRYTRRSLARTLRAAGLEVGLTRYMFRSLYAVAAGLTITGLQRRPVMIAPRHPALHRAAAGFLKVEDALLGGLPIPGLSVLGIGLSRSLGRVWQKAPVVR